MVQALMPMPLLLQILIYKDKDYDDPAPVGLMYLITETAIYLLRLVMNLIFFNFLFKFHQVEIELLMM